MDPVRKKQFSEVYNGTRFSASELYKIVQQAAVAGKSQVVIPPGIYFSDKARGCHVSFENLEHLKIIADDVLLLCDSANRALSFEDCKNVTLKGLAIDYTINGFPFTQGTLIEKQGRTGIIQLHKGYPRLSKGMKEIRKIGGYNSGSLLLKELLPTHYAAKFKIIDDDTIEVENILTGLEIGDYVTMVQKQITSHGLTVGNGEKMVFENVTLHTAPMFSILDHGSKQSVYRGVRITPGPIPDGATVPRLKSGSQDGIHIKDTKGEKGVLIENCLINSHSDDAIAINTPYSLIVEAEKGYAVLAGKNAHMNLAKNDIVRYTRTKDMAILGELKVANIERITDEAECARLQKTKMGFTLSPFLRNAALKQAAFWKIRLKGNIAMSPTDFLSLASGNKGAIIRNNTIRNHRARAMMLKTSDVLIENNTVFHSQMSGITFSVEKYWLEGDYGSNITIRAGVLKSRASNFSWVKDTSFKHVDIHSSSNVESVRTFVLSDFLNDDRTFVSTSVQRDP